MRPKKTHPKQTHRHHGPCAALKYDTLSWPGPDLNRQTSAGKVCHDLGKVYCVVDCRRTGGHAGNFGQQGPPGKLYQQVLQTNFAGRPRRQTLQAHTSPAGPGNPDRQAITGKLCLRKLCQKIPPKCRQKKADKVCQSFLAKAGKVCFYSKLCLYFKTL